MRLTVAQALIRFLGVQYSERDGMAQRLIPGCFGIFGHGNVAGVGQALLQEPDVMPYYHARNEQGMVHAPSSEAWWDVPVAETAQLESTRDARAVYERNKATQHTYLRTSEKVTT